MEYGYFTMPLHPPDSDYTQTLDEDLEQIIVLDRSPKPLIATRGNSTVGRRLWWV